MLNAEDRLDYHNACNKELVDYHLHRALNWNSNYLAFGQNLTRELSHVDVPLLKHLEDAIPVNDNAETRVMRDRVMRTRSKLSETLKAA